MGREVERKFLVEGSGWGPGKDGVLQRQGYLAVTERGTVRVRIEGGRATMTVKGPQAGITRAEYEYKIPLADAEEMLATLCTVVLEKTRHARRHGSHLWEIDVFHGENEGLVTAEVELEREDELFDLPRWAGRDVSHDPRYRAAYLASHPFRTWK